MSICCWQIDMDEWSQDGFANGKCLKRNTLERKIELWPESVMVSLIRNLALANIESVVDTYFLTKLLKLPSNWIAKSRLRSSNSSLNKQPRFIVLHLSTVTKLVDPASNSATRQGGMEEPSVKVNVFYFVFFQAPTRRNKVIVWCIHRA